MGINGTESGGKRLCASRDLGCDARQRRRLRSCAAVSAATASGLGGRSAAVGQAAVAALGHQQRQPHVVLGEVRQGGVAELMQRPAGLGDEQLRGATVRQPRPAGERADVAGGRRAGRARAQAGEEHRSGAAAGDQAWQQLGAARAEERPVDVAALGACAGAPGGDVEVLDVQAQDLVGAGGGLVEQPPQRALAQVDVAALPQPLEARHGDAAGVVVLLSAARQLDVAGDREDPGARAVGRKRTDGRDVAVPGRRRRVMPALRDDAGQAGAGHGARRRARPRGP